MTARKDSTFFVLKKKFIMNRYIYMPAVNVAYKYSPLATTAREKTNKEFISF
jgi:hypothetical protein